MNADKLFQDLTATVQEMLMKLDAPAMTLSLNYPLPTLNRLLGTRLEAEEMMETLREAFAAQEAIYGLLTAKDAGDGLFCVTVPKAGAEYMLSHGGSADFLRELIGQIKAHGEIEAVLAVFDRHGKAHAEKTNNPEFDYLVYFEDGQPDSCRYCLSQHGGHVSYHRFAKEDYEAFGF